MDMTGEQLIPVPQAEVWRALNDPEVLKACIAGCEAIERVSDTEYRVVMVASVGPVKAKFNGKLLLSDLKPPNSYSLSFEGSGGAAGFHGHAPDLLGQGERRRQARPGRLATDRRGREENGGRLLHRVQREARRACGQGRGSGGACDR